MNQLAKRLAHPLKVEYSTLVETISAVEQGYIVQTKNTNTHKNHSYFAKSILMTCPIPQSLSILHTSHYVITAQDRILLEKVKYTRCIGILALLSDPSILPDGYLSQPVPGVISWIGDNKQKGICESPSLTLHLDSEWSNTHYDKNDAMIWELILPYLTKLFGNSIDPNLTHQIKRWRFAQAYDLIEAPYLDIGKSYPLVICGDAFSSINTEKRSKVENAALSGMAAADYLLDIRGRLC